MEPSVRDTLRQLIVRYGHSLCDDPRRCEAMLRDLCGQHKREVFILVSALRQRVAADLLGGSGGLPTPLLLGRLGKRLEDELALTGEAAHWAVETWALALGVIAGPVPTTAMAPPQVETSVVIDSAALRLLFEPEIISTRAVIDSAALRPLEPEMISIPAGRFLMGSPPRELGRAENEGPQHWVQIPAFELGKHAITIAEWNIYATDSGRGYEKRGGRQHPVIGVYWDDAQRYIQWLNRKTGRAYRLPSEAEWEYAARAGTTTPFSTGYRITTSQANYNNSYDYNHYGERAWKYLAVYYPVGSYPPNPWGLFEMHGNVWEWVEDSWHENYAGAPTDGSPWRQEIAIPMYYAAVLGARAPWNRAQPYASDTIPPTTGRALGLSLSVFAWPGHLPLDLYSLLPPTLQLGSKPGRSSVPSADAPLERPNGIPTLERGNEKALEREDNRFAEHCP